ncbi:MAG: hypothetical protein RLZZ252_994 [Bacteroidota bacterium]|jgi:exonuclease III
MLKKQLIGILFLGFFLNIGISQVPKVGSDTTLDIANWNIEWFGDSLNGPSNENTQLTNAVNVIKSMDMDIWGLCEISNSGYWQKLQNELGDYSAVITNYAQTQKTALLYRKSQFKLIYSKSILLAYEFEFASGRFPLEVALEWDRNGQKDTLYCWVIHLKANTGSTTEKQSAYNRRQLAAEALKKYIDARKSWKGVVLGDWNDDLDISIFSSKETPFLGWRNDTNYIFPSYRLSQAKVKSTASYSDMIDHQCLTPRLKWHWNRKSSGVMNGDAYIGSYRFNTSDHYPVWSVLSYNSTEPKPGFGEVVEYGDVSSGNWYVFGGRVYCTEAERLVATLRHNVVELVDIRGKKLGDFAHGDYLNFPSGNYLLKWEKDGIWYCKQVFL